MENYQNDYPNNLDQKILNDFHGNKPIIDETQVANPTIEDTCISYLKTLISNETDFIRICIEGGGCAGFQYAFYINEPDIVSTDTIININPKVVIDEESIKYMKGSIIKYDNTPFNQRVYIDNPGAKSSCGCGTSFSYDFEKDF